MNQVNVKVSFYLKKSEADADGMCPVMARLNVGKYSEAAFSVKLRVPQSMWNSGRASGKSVKAKEINNRLDEIRAMALSVYAELSAVRDGVTAGDVQKSAAGHGGRTSNTTGLLPYVYRKLCKAGGRKPDRRQFAKLSQRLQPCGEVPAGKVQLVGHPVFGIEPFFHRRL